MSSINASTLSNLYIPDFQAWSEFYENRLKQGPKVGFGFQTEQEALKDRDQLQKLAFNQSERTPVSCQSSLPDTKIVNIVSPTEQTLLQAESVMRKSKPTRTSSGFKKSKCDKNTKVRRQSKSKKGTSRAIKKKQTDSFNYRNLRDIFSKKK